MFVIGDTKVRPRLGDDSTHSTFKRNEPMFIYTQFYNFGVDEKNHKPNAEIHLEVVKSGSNEALLEQTELVAGMPGASGSQVTIEKRLSLATLAPGQYELRMKITDKIRNQTLSPTAKFTVVQGRTN